MLKSAFLFNRVDMELHCFPLCAPSWKTLVYSFYEIVDRSPFHLARFASRTALEPHMTSFMNLCHVLGRDHHCCCLS